MCDSDHTPVPGRSTHYDTTVVTTTVRSHETQVPGLVESHAIFFSFTILQLVCLFVFS